MHLEQSSTSVPVGAETRGLRFLWLEITKRCNLGCRHCYTRSSPTSELLGTMSEADWIRVIHEARAVGCQHMQFIGGEPLVHPSFPILLRAAHAAGMNVEVFTNATLLEDDTADLFQTLGTHVAVSVYAEDALTHDRVTARLGSHQKTKEGICRLVDRGVDLRVGIIEQAENAGRIDEATQFVRSLGVERVGVDHIRAVGRGDRGGSTGFKADPLAALCGQCHKGRLAIDVHGDAFPCVFGRAFPVGNVKGGLAELLRAGPIESFRSKQQEYLERNPLQICSPCRPGCDPNTNCSP